MNIIEELGLPQLKGFEATSGGARALHRPDLAPLAYEVKLIASAYGHLDETGISAYLDGANREFFETLYKSCNGVFVGATKFGVFGFVAGDQSVSVPWNIGTPNIEMNAERPDGTLIVGTSTETNSLGAREQLYHSIQSHREICVNFATDFSVVVRRYGSVLDWLTSEVHRALADKDHW